MKPCDMDTGSGRFRHGLQEVFRVWEEASEEWNDSAAGAVFEEHLAPMTPIVKGALDAVGRMRHLLHEAQRELEG